MEYCTIVENDHQQVKIYNDDSDVRIANCIIADGMSGVGGAIGSNAFGFVTHCVLSGNPGGDTPECDEFENIYYFPLFCDAGADDYTLCSDSPASAGTNIWGEQIGAYLASCEACDTPVEPSTWGAVKALYR